MHNRIAFASPLSWYFVTAVLAACGSDNSASSSGSGASSGAGSGLSSTGSPSAGSTTAGSDVAGSGLSVPSSGTPSGSGTGSMNGAGSVAAIAGSVSGSGSASPSGMSSSGVPSGSAVGGSGSGTADASTGAPSTSGGNGTSSGTSADAGTPQESGAILFSQVYANVLVPNNCTSHHAGTNPSGGLDMSTEAKAYADLVGQMSAETNCGQTYVVAGNAGASLLYQKVLGTSIPAHCGERMPYGAPNPISEADMTMLQTWINAGAPQ